MFTSILNKFNFTFFLFVFCLAVFALSIRGIPGNPVDNELNTVKWRNLGPFEQTARFALTYSIVENNSIYLSVPLARFASPDLAINTQGQFVSLFAPGVSLIAIPGYVIGRELGFAQVGTFAVITFFTLLNIFLIRSIAIKLKINTIAAAIGGLTFAFATPAFAYGVDFFQHHISTFLILFSIYAMLYYRTFWGMTVVWFCFATAVIVDYPNFFMMLPVGVFAFFRFFNVQKTEKFLKLKINFIYILSFIGAMIPLLFFMWFNYVSYGNPLVLSGGQTRVTQIASDGSVAKVQNVNNNKPPRALSGQLGLLRVFSPRNTMQGIHVHIFSYDRGILVYTPVMVLGIIGAIAALLKKKKFSVILSFIVLLNVFMYSMWGDPWGGWSFGSRYLIPSYAILSIFIAYLLTIFNKQNMFTLLFFVAVTYSVAVNTLGALTSSLNPPSVEAEVISREAGYDFKYSIDRNIDFLSQQGSKSLFFNIFAQNYVSAWDYYIYITAGLISVFGILLILNFRKQNPETMKI